MIDGNAVVYCQGYFNTLWGKTAHGLARFTRRYRIVGIIDGRYAGSDAGEVLDGRSSGIPVFSDLDGAIKHADTVGTAVTHFVFGIAPDGGALTPEMRADILEAVNRGLNVDCGMHTFLSDDPVISRAAQANGVTLRDVRKTPPRGELHGYTGRIGTVHSLRVAMLGTDSSVGKRTTAWKLVAAFENRGISAELIGTGQTAWMQGARYGVIMDALINDFVAGEIEHAILEAWDANRPDVMVIEGQGSLMNPIYPGGFEILAAGQPHAVVMQHAPARRDYDGIPGTPVHPLDRQIQAVELLSDKPVVAVTLNHEGMTPVEVDEACRRIAAETGLPVRDGLTHNLDPVVDAVLASRDRPRDRGRDPGRESSS